MSDSELEADHADTDGNEGISPLTRRSPGLVEKKTNHEGVFSRDSLSSEAKDGPASDDAQDLSHLADVTVANTATESTLQLSNLVRSRTATNTGSQDTVKLSKVVDVPAEAAGAGLPGLEDLEALEDPVTPLQELTSFASDLFRRENLPWLSLRAIPLVAVLIVGIVVLPSSDDNSDLGLSIRATDALVPQVELAEVAPGLNYDEDPSPRLLAVTGDDDAEADADSMPGAEDGQETAGIDADVENPDDPATESDASTEGDAAVASVESDTTTTTARPSSTTATTAAPTTEAPTTRPPTTLPPTTRPPTTLPPTTRPPTTLPPTTQPPTTLPPTTQPQGNGCAAGDEFEWIFRDDFNGSSVGPAWNQYYSAGNAGYGLRRPSANTVRDGKLVITAQMQDGALVSGGMSHNVNQTYGKYVFRVRTDNDPSQAVSGVVLTWPTSGVHPRDGENNVYETLVQTPNRNPFFTFIHKPFGSKSDQEYKEHWADGAQWQTMTMEWTPSRITIIRDGPGNNGNNYDRWTVNETSADLIPDVSHRLAIQLDGWKHSIGSPVRMEVDFVEVYKYCG